RRARYDRLLARADHDRRRLGDVAADDAVEHRLGRHADHRLDRAGVDILALDDAVVEPGQHLAGAAGGFGLALDLHAIAARADIDAEPVLDRNQVLVIFAEQAAEQLRPIEQDL